MRGFLSCKVSRISIMAWISSLYMECHFTLSITGRGGWSPGSSRDMSEVPRQPYVQMEEAPMLASQLDPPRSIWVTLRILAAFPSVYPRCLRTSLSLLALLETQGPEDSGQTRDPEFFLSLQKCSRHYFLWGKKLDLIKFLAYLHIGGMSGEQGIVITTVRP